MDIVEIEEVASVLDAKLTVDRRSAIAQMDPS